MWKILEFLLTRTNLSGKICKLFPAKFDYYGRLHCNIPEMLMHPVVDKKSDSEQNKKFCLHVLSFFYRISYLHKL